MNQTLHLATWRGIRIGAHWSLLIVASLLSWSFATTLFPDVAPGYPPGAYWVAGVLTMAAFLLSIVLHELSHAREALRAGVEVERVTLWLFGGIAELGGQPPTWQTQFRIAIAGPIGSLLLSAVGFGGVLLFGAFGAGDLAKASVGWLAGTNLVLALFNLLPGAPLDGGRVLTAILWQRHGDAKKARRQSAVVGVGLGRLLIVAGIALVFFSNAGSGLWIGFLGWFVMSAAAREVQAESVDEALLGVTVRDVMSPRPTTVTPSMDLGWVVDHVIASTRHTSLPVVVDGRPVGLLTTNSIRAIPAERWTSATAGECALGMKDVVIAREHEALNEVMHRSSSAQARIMVLDDTGRVIGLITPTDIIRTVQRELLRHRTGHPVGI